MPSLEDLEKKVLSGFETTWMVWTSLVTQLACTQLDLYARSLKLLRDQYSFVGSRMERTFVWAAKAQQKTVGSCIDALDVLKGTAKGAG